MCLFPKWNLKKETNSAKAFCSDAKGEARHIMEGVCFVKMYLLCLDGSNRHVAMGTGRIWPYTLQLPRPPVLQWKQGHDGGGLPQAQMKKGTKIKIKLSHRHGENMQSQNQLTSTQLGKKPSVPLRRQYQPLHHQAALYKHHKSHKNNCNNKPVNLRWKCRRNTNYAFMWLKRCKLTPAGLLSDHGDHMKRL